MSLTETYKQFIIEKVLKEFLYDGTIPTEDALDEALTTYQNTHPNLSEPQAKFIDYEIDRGSNSSVAKITEISSAFDEDISVITRELRNIIIRDRLLYERWSYELQRLLAKSTKLEHRIDSLLLLQEDTAGYFAHVGDVFSDLSLVDTNNTTARIDINETSVIINPDTRHPVSGATSLVDLSGLEEEDVTFAPLSVRRNTSTTQTYSTIGEENSLSNIFKSVNSKWVSLISSKSNGNMISELKVRINKDADTSVSRIALKYTGPDANGDTTITCQYSADGYTWYLVPSSDATKILSGMTSWYFPITVMRWVKFIITKNSSDRFVNGEYIYDYSIESIRLFGHSFSSTDGNTFYSKALEATDSEGQPIRFSKTSLETCEEILSDTDIEYYLSGSKNNTSWTDWFRIQPVNREDNILYPKSLNIGGSSVENNKDDDPEVFDTSITGDTAVMKLTRDFNNTGISLLGYKFTHPDNAAINTAIQVASDTNPNVVSNGIEVWRNIYNLDTSDPFVSSTVRNTPAGWGFKDDFYTCYFEVVRSDGIILDFGDKECFIDEQPIKGKILVAQGVHKFRTASSNWYDISTAATEYLSTSSTINISDETTLSELDLLYPYNHKLVIEGFPYINSFNGQQIYSGTDRYAEYYAKKTSLFDLENNTDIQDFGWFAVRNIGNTSTILAVIVRRDMSIPDYDNELFYVKWRVGIGADLYRYIKLKAVLTTKDTSKTPLFTSYRIKLGY